MTWDGVTTVEVVAGREGLWGIRNKNLIPMGGLIAFRNATLEDHSWRVGGGGTFLGVSLGAGVTIDAALDFWPDTATQRTVACGDDGALYKDDGVGAVWTTLTTGLTTAGRVPVWYAAGAEAAGNNRKAIYCDRINAPRVLSGDGIVTTALSAPPADWGGANQPGGGVIHQGFNWMFGNANSPHTVYRSLQNAHEDFTTTAYSLRVFPGEGERLVAGLTYKGILVLWKYPEGVYAVDTSDPSSANWRVIKIGSPGAAGPSNPIAIEDDLMWVAADGSWHLLSATTATGSVRAEDLAARKLGSYHRDQINLSRLQFAQMIYYSNKQEVQLACSAIGQTAKNRRLHLDLNRRTEIGERWIWWDADRNEALFTRKRGGILIPAMGDNVGQIWELDRINRNRNNAAYTFEWFLRDSDFGEVVPGWQGKYKNLRFLQIEYDGRSSATHTVDVYVDGKLKQSLTFTLAAGGAALPAVLPFTLGTESLLFTARRRLLGRGRRIALRGTSAVINQDISITRVLIGMEAGE